MNTSIEDKNDNLSLNKVIFLVFVPTTILTAVYVLLGYVQKAIPSLLLFYALALVILFPFELSVILRASKKEFGNYSVRSAFANQEKPNWKKTLLYGSLLFGFAGIVSVTIGPWEKSLTTPISNKLAEIIPVYFDWYNMEYLRQYPKNILLFTCVAYGVLNVFVGPVIEELYFRGYLTSRISNWGKYAPVLITVCFPYIIYGCRYKIFFVFLFFCLLLISPGRKKTYT